MRRPSKPREDLLVEFEEVFKAHGFEGTSMSMLTKKTGLEKASLYYHFPEGKTEMASIVLTEALKRLDSTVLSPLRSDKEPWQRITAMLSALAEFYNQGQDVCLISIFTLSGLKPEVSQKMRSALLVWKHLISKALKELNISSPKTKAQNALSLIQGSLILAKTLDDPKIFEMAISQIKNDWKKQ